MSLNSYIDYVILPILMLSTVFTFIRLYKGPKIYDRVIALDLLITTGIGIITIYSIRTNQEIFLDVAMISALIAFLGTIAFAYYLEKRSKND